MKIKFIILGCGSSFGVPRADGYWGKCDPKEKKLKGLSEIEMDNLTTKNFETLFFN